ESRSEAIVELLWLCLFSFVAGLVDAIVGGRTDSASRSFYFSATATRCVRAARVRHEQARVHVRHERGRGAIRAPREDSLGFRPARRDDRLRALRDRRARGSTRPQRFSKTARSY